MKVITNIINKNRIDDYINSDIDIFIVGEDTFSSRHGVDFTINEIKVLKSQLKIGQSIYISLNQLYEQYQLAALNDYLKALDDIGVDAVIFQDFAIIQLKNEYNYSFDLVYEPMTLNTNIYTLNYLKTLGVKQCFLSREISIDDISLMFKEADIELIVQLHGIRYMAQSKRKLLSHYLEAKNVEKSKDDVYIIQPENSDMKNYLYENEQGTHILSTKPLISFDLIEAFSDLKLNYGFIQPLFMEIDEQIDIINIYKKAFEVVKNKDVFKTLIENTKSFDGDYGFYYDSTIYKLDDVRRREANERNK